MKKQYIFTIILFFAVGAGAFYGGIRYNKSKLSPAGFSRGENNFSSGEQRGNRQEGMPSGGQRMGGNVNNNNGDFVAGEIISKDDKSITVKTKNGGSRIVYFSDSTTIGKTTEGLLFDLNLGQQIMATGKNDSSGSVVAQNIQIRPE